MPAIIEHHAPVQAEAPKVLSDALEARTLYSRDIPLKKIIKFDRDFINQINQLPEYYKDTDISKFKNKFTLSLNYILSMQPEKFSFELTEEKSAFFTIKKNNYTLFFQQYFELIDSDDDEALLSIYFGENKKPSMAGSAKYILEQISGLIMPPESDTGMMAY